MMASRRRVVACSVTVAPVNRVKYWKRATAIIKLILRDAERKHLMLAAAGPAYCSDVFLSEALHGL
jgi:hypothetical protein